MVTLEDLFERHDAGPRIGVFGCGCWFYWGQFPELKERLVAHQAVFEDRLRASGIDVVSGGLVDGPQLAREIGG